jgi:glycosyltransferase involved in cell wall biosynthesis
MLSVLSVAYPLAPVGPDAVGGAEQVLATLDAALIVRGARSTVIACEGSRVAGRLVSIPAFPPSDAVKPHAWAAQIAALRQHQEEADIVHIHSLDVAPLLPHLTRPALVTLHLPFSYYDRAALSNQPGVWFHCVSYSQSRDAPRGLNLLPPIPNGVDLTRFGGFSKRRFVLFLGRICPEKGVHLAIAAAKLAGYPLAIAGAVFGYDAHRRYFENEVRPHLGHGIRFVGSVGGRAKRRLLASAHALLLPALADETSSLAAREAAASGTAVIAFRRGALPETVDGQTGYIVDNIAAMAEAIKQSAIEPRACRLHAERHFSHQTMVEGYIDAYRTIQSSSSSSSSGSPSFSSRLTNL